MTEHAAYVSLYLGVGFYSFPVLFNIAGRDKRALNAIPGCHVFEKGKHPSIDRIRCYLKILQKSFIIAHFMTTSLHHVQLTHEDKIPSNARSI